MKATNLYTFTLLAVLTGGCATAEQQAQDPGAAFESAYASAEAARQKAASVNGEWRDTAKILKAAKEAAAAGNYEQAMALAKKAQQQGESGHAQALSQQNAGFPSYM